MFYWPVENPSDFSPDAFPVFFSDFEGSNPFYGIPIQEYSGLFKVKLMFIYHAMTLKKK